MSSRRYDTYWQRFFRIQAARRHITCTLRHQMMEYSTRQAPVVAAILVCRRFELRTHARSRGHCLQSHSQLIADGGTWCSMQLFVKLTAGHWRIDSLHPRLRPSAVERAHVPIGGSESFWSITIEHLVRRRPVVTGVECDTGGRLLRGRGRGRHGTAGLGVAIVRIGEQRVTLCTCVIIQVMRWGGSL